MMMRYYAIKYSNGKSLILAIRLAQDQIQIVLNTVCVTLNV